MTETRRRAINDLTGAVPFLDRESESRRVAEAIRRKQSLMICGPAGIGKTALILNVLHGLPGGLAKRCLYLSAFKDLQDFLRQLIQTLYQAKNPYLRRQLHADGVSILNFKAWLNALSTSRLKGTLYRTVEKSDYRVCLDHAPPLTHAVAKVIKELFRMRNTPIYLLIRDDVEHRAEQFIGFFYWGHRERLKLGPLPAASAQALLESYIKRFGLSRFDLVGFRKEVLELSGCAPGAIVKMCALAADPRYQYGSRIKLKLVHIDYLMSGQNSHFSVRKRNGRVSDN